MKSVYLKTYILALLAIAICSSCSKDDTNSGCVSGEGAITTSTIAISEFTGIDLAFTSDIIVNQGTTQEVRATGHPNIIDLISTNVSNNVWTADFGNNLCVTDFDLSIEVTIPSLRSLSINGTGDLTVNEFTDQSGQLVIEITGTGNISLNNFSGIDGITASLSGTGNFTAEENIDVENLNIINSSTGDFFGFEINCNDAIANASGTGDTELTANNTLDVIISGTGDVAYKGMPSITSEVTGTGNLIDAN